MARRSEWRVVVGFGCLALVLVGAAWFWSRPLHAQEGSPPSVDPPHEESIPYSATSTATKTPSTTKRALGAPMSAEEAAANAAEPRAGVDNEKSFDSNYAQNGEPEYTAGVTFMVTQAHARIAERVAGTTGLNDVGVQ